MSAQLIGSVLLIAGAEAAVFCHKNALHAWKLDEDGELLACHQQAQFFQDTPAEKRMLHNVRDLAQVKRELASWVKWQRTLHYLIAGMDVQLRDSTRTMALELAEEYLADDAAGKMATARLFGCPLPPEADLAGALRLAQPFVRCTRLYLDLEQTHDSIEPVKQVLEDLAEQYATAEHNARQIYITLVDNGVAAAAARAVSQHDRKAIEELLWQFSGNRTLLQNCPQLKKILGSLCQNLLLAVLPPQGNATPAFMVMQETAPYEVTAIRLDPLVAALHTELEKGKSGKKNHHPSGMVGKAAADKQKQFILEAHGKGQTGKVQQHIIDLIRNQLQAGKATHLCKSLCVLGKEFTYRHDAALALRVYEVAKLADPNDAVSYTSYAETLRSLGQFEEALKAYGEAKSRFPQDVVCYAGYAETLRSLGQFEEALKAYGEAKSRFPHDDVCHAGYAETLRSMGRVDEAFKAYGEAKSLFSQNEVCHNGYAETLRSLGQFDEALKAYAEAKSRFPQNDVCHNGYAETLRSLGQFDEALKAYGEAKSRFAQDVVCHAGYAETLRSLGQFEEALKAYGEAKSRFPQDVVCHAGYAETLRSLGQFEEALKAYGEAKSRFSQDVVCHAGYAETLRSLGQFDEALKAYGEVKSRFPQNAVCHAGYAETLRSLGQPQQAMAEYRQLLLRFPKNRVIGNALACLLIEQGELADAEKLISCTNPKTDHDWRDHHVLAMLKLKQGDTVTAEEMLREGAESALLPSQRAIFHQTLSCLYLRQQNYTQAAQSLQPESARIIEFPLDRVLRAHAMAGLNQLGEASACLEQTASSETQIILIKDFIIRRYGLQGNAQPDPMLEQALCDAEFSYLLRAA